MGRKITRGCSIVVDVWEVGGFFFRGGCRVLMRSDLESFFVIRAFFLRYEFGIALIKMYYS